MIISRFDIYTQHQRLIWAISYTNRYILSRAQIAFGNSISLHIPGQGPVGTGYYARPAPDTLVSIHIDCSRNRISVHSTSKTTVDAPRLRAMTTLNGKRKLPLSLHAD